MSKIILQNFDSFRRTDGGNSEPIFNIPSSGIYANSFEIDHINIPTTWYNINSTNNILLWDDTLGAAVTTTITPGNYTATELATEIGTQMTSDETVGDTYTCTYDSTTQKFTIAGDGGNFELTLADTSNIWDTNSPTRNLAKLMGFYVETGYLNSGLIGADEASVFTKTGAATYTGGSVAYINTRNVYVKTNLVNQALNYNSRTFIKKINNPSLPNPQLLENGKNDILKVLPYNVDQGDQIIYRPFYPEQFILDKRDGLTNISFCLEDDFGNILDLNGQSWNIVIKFNL